MAAAWRAWWWLGRVSRRALAAWLPGILVALIVLGHLLAPWPALAEEKREFKYPYGWVYKAALRLIKIDLGCEIEELDKETGFILFRYEYKDVKSPASIEIMDLTEEDKGYLVNTRVVMSKFPSWVEEDLLDQLEAKLKNEYGDPPKPPKKPEPPPEKKPEDGEKKKEKED